MGDYVPKKAIIIERVCSGNKNGYFLRCNYCGKRFYARKSCVEKGNALYCSTKCNGLDKIGFSPNGFGWHHSEETKRKIGESHKGRKHTEESKLKMSQIRTGKSWEQLFGEEKAKKFKENQSKAVSGVNNGMYGRRHSLETRKKMSENKPDISGKNNSMWGKRRADMSGSNHWNWRGGKSFEPYSYEFTEELKEGIRKRDNYRCQECFRHQDELYRPSGQKYSLHVHHIDYDKKNSNSDNLISLCNSCHAQTHFDRDEWTDYFRDKMEGVMSSGNSA